LIKVALDENAEVFNKAAAEEMGCSSSASSRSSVKRSPRGFCASVTIGGGDEAGNPAGAAGFFQVRS
jgi:hypothetical protein